LTCVTLKGHFFFNESLLKKSQRFQQGPLMLKDFFSKTCVADSTHGRGKVGSFFLTVSPTLRLWHVQVAMVVERGERGCRRRNLEGHALYLCYRSELLHMPPRHHPAPIPLTIRATPVTPPTQRKRKRSDSEQAESSNLYNRILRAMHTVGVPETEARVRYARLFMCCLAMRGVCRRWQAAWALHAIIKDWLMCPSEEAASESFLLEIQVLEQELSDLCFLK
jgi:hypothetical protein